VRLRACLALVVTAGLTVVPPAGAHLKSGVPSTDFEARIAGFRPGVSGLGARALDGDQRLELRVAPPHVVVVLGLLGEPFLRFSPGGVEANLASPTTTSMGVVAAADAVSSSGVRRRRVSRGHTFAWHEHRLRPLGVVRTHDAGGRAVASFSIPLLVDGRRAALTGAEWHASRPRAWPWLLAGALLVGAATLVARRASARTRRRLAFGLLPLTVAFLAPAARRLRKLARGAQSGQGDLGHRLQEGLQGLSAIQVDGLEGREREQFHQLSRRTLAQQLSGARLRAASSSLMEVAAVLGVTAMLWVAEIWVAHGPLRAEHLFSFLASALVLTQQLKPLTKVGQFTAIGEAAAQRLLEIEGAARSSIPAEGLVRAAARPLQDAIRFEDVWFRYPARPAPEGTASAGEPTLAGLNLTIRRGERLALVGESGAGKTTLVALLLGLYRPDRGRILFDGQPIDRLEPQSLHRQFSWMGQEASLFDTTFGENISMGRPIERERLATAAERASARDFIDRSGGFDARVGQRGGKLSGGERQRIALARALYWDGPLLLLDEPTSQLDARNERQIGEALDGLMEGRTVLVVAHRLATIRRCDRVAVLGSGKVVEEGPPEELIARQGALSRLVAAQSSLQASEI
jgi:ABC-type multidrug transport system fused ATPase/permease subunit